ncbi:IclR family transcriptional regulator [Microvirga aerophila]|jgi:DNA-binding IclR family transcriptional regulator|uniref:IclR family transcriptional regulator n=1 Tax=Microvirga aerophila TaxID=670291 RepID=A0A512C0Q6_9HYPH|nr:IclR family transcriptional regulator [Microvirga aerophila]GEO17637.1 IclR family transcriptional regulator [Microvirga aerophila]
MDDLTRRPLKNTPHLSAPAARERQRGIDRVIDLLETLLHQRAPTRIGDIAHLINAPRSTTYEIVNRLIEADILESVGAEGHVYFGKTSHLFGRAYADANPFYRRCRETLDQLVAETGATAQLCALKGRKYVVIDQRDGTGLFRITTDIGIEVPIPWTASGRLLLDHMSSEEIENFVPAGDFQLPDGRLLELSSFLSDVTQARADGYFLTKGLADSFTCCLAAPIRNRSGAAVATLCFTIPVNTETDAREVLLTRLVASANELSGTII